MQLLPMASTWDVHATYVFTQPTVCLLCTDDEFMQIGALYVRSDLILSSSQVVLLPAPRATLHEHLTATEGCIAQSYIAAASRTGPLSSL